MQCIVHSDSRTALEGCALKRWGLNHQKWNVCKLSCHFLLRSLLEIQLIQLHDRQFIFKQFLTLVCHRCLLELWPFISYNWLFLWDYTFYFHGIFLVLITGITRSITAITVDILSICPLPADQLRSLSPSDLGWMALLRSLHGGVRRRHDRALRPSPGIMVSEGNHPLLWPNYSG